MQSFGNKKLGYVFVLALLFVQVQLQPIQPIEQSFANYQRKLGSYCGAFVANNFVGHCDWPIQTAWPYDLLQNKFTSEGPLYIIVSKTKVMPPFVDPTNPLPTYLSQWNGVNLSDWLALPAKFPSSFVLPLPSCGTEFGFVEQTINFPINVFFTVPTSTPDSALGAPTNTPIFATPPECRGEIFFDQTPICAATKAQQTEINCQPDSFTDCQSTHFSPTVKTPPYHSPDYPSSLGYQGFPATAEFYQIGAYTTLTPECASGYGYDYGQGFPTANQPYDTTGTGIKSDLGYPSSIMGTIRVKIPDSCNLAGVDQVMFQFTGMYNRMDYVPCVVNYDDTVDPNNPFAPWTSRTMFCAGLSCQADAPRSPKSTILSPQNVAEFAPFCRVSFPYNATLYGSGAGRVKYLQATGGVIQPAAAANIGYGTVPMSIAINNLPSNNYAVFLNMTGQTPLFWQLIPNFNPVPLFGTPLGLRNGQFVQFVQPDATTSIPNQYIILEQLYNNYTDPTPIMYPFDQPWLPACGCNTTSAMTDGTVICDSNYNFIGEQVLSVPNYNGGAAALTPICQIVPGSGYSWFGDVYGNVLQNTIYGLSVQLINSSSNAGFNYQWYINDTANNNIEISDPTLPSTYIRVLGSYTANIGIAVTSRDTRLTGTCNVTLTVFRGCPVISLVATNTTTSFNTTIVLDASRTLSPEPTVQLSYTWSVFSSYPADAMSRLVMPYTNRPTIPLSATNVSIFVILLEVTGARPDGTFCTATQTITINFFNGTNDFTDIGNPDGILIPDSCFQNSLLNETFPETGKDPPVLSTPPGLLPGPVSAVLNVHTTVMHYLTKWMSTKTNENYKINGYQPTDVNNDLLLGIIIGVVSAISALFLIFLLAPMEYCTNYPMLCTPACCIRCRDKMSHSKCGKCCKKKKSRFLRNPEESKAIR